MIRSIVRWLFVQFGVELIRLEVVFRAITHDERVVYRIKGRGRPCASDADVRAEAYRALRAGGVPEADWPDEVVLMVGNAVWRTVRLKESS